MTGKFIEIYLIMAFDNYMLYVLVKKQVIYFKTDKTTYVGQIPTDIAYPVSKDEINRLSCIVYLYKNPKKIL